MSDVIVGGAVLWRGQTWRVLGLVEGSGGASVAQLESLDRDHFASVAVEKLEVEELTAAEVESRLAERESLMAPLRAVNRRRLHRKVLRRLKAERGEANERGDVDRARALGERIERVQSELGGEG